jgi:cellulose synthase/poly-beta-1,6-N-acetylglucosamine synthase-like glycosyltransferase
MISHDGIRFAVMALSTGYFAVWAVTQLFMSGITAAFIWKHRRSHTLRARAVVDRITTPLVSVIVPGHNEELTIVQSLRALLSMDYEPLEIVVVNDGSTDGTLDVLRQTFELIAAPVAYAQPLPSEAVRAAYRSATELSLIVVDKESGGSKSDAVNAGINAASGELVLVMDADTVLEPDAVTRAVLPFLDVPSTIAVGANVAIVNGSRVDGGRVTDVALPASWLARFQIVEYMRAFLLFRTTCAAANTLLILSGAFGLFRRDAVIAVGGYDPNAIGEDMDLTFRLQRHFRQRGEPFRIVFDPSPLCSTQAPEDFTSLRSQRYRWRRGLMQVLWRYRGMIGNPRYGLVGVGALPYLTIFEGAAPLLEFASYALATVALIAGIFDWRHYLGVLAVWTLFGTAVTMAAVLLNDVATKRYLRGRDLILLFVAALIENCGYRQLNTWWGVVGTVQALTGKGGWGTMKRRAFTETTPSESASPQPSARRDSARADRPTPSHRES